MRRLVSGLRLLSGKVQRSGSCGAPFASDVRIVAATHQDIDGAIAASRFREDLYVRLGVVPIPLAERADILFAGAVIGAGEVEALLGLKAGPGVPCIAPAAPLPPQ